MTPATNPPAATDAADRRLQVSVDAPAGLHVGWHPRAGRALLTPSFRRAGDVTLAERLRWGRTSATALSGVHTDTVTHSAFSANGAQPPVPCCR